MRGTVKADRLLLDKRMERCGDTLSKNTFIGETKKKRSRPQYLNDRDGRMEENSQCNTESVKAHRFVIQIEAVVIWHADICESSMLGAADNFTVKKHGEVEEALST